MHLAQVRLSCMDCMTLITLHHLDEPLSLAMASSLECSTFAARDPHGRQGSFKISISTQRVPASVTGRAKASRTSVWGQPSPCPRLVADNGKSVRLCLDITPGSQDSGERKGGDNTWSLWDGTAKVDEAVTKRRSQSLAR
ncbi:hypothetical protein V8E53_012161 [Lactarius tabidus]